MTAISRFVRRIDRINMMVQLLSRGTRKMQASLIAGLILLSGQSRGASVFEALGLSPGQVARAGSLPPVSALATLPASGDERQQLIAAM